MHNLVLKRVMRLSNAFTALERATYLYYHNIFAIISLFIPQPGLIAQQLHCKKNDFFGEVNTL